MDEFVWIVLRDFNLRLICAAIILNFWFSHRKAATFSLTLFLFYVFAVYFDGEIQSNDPDKVWRYLRWSLIDVAFLSTLYLLVKRSLVHVGFFFASCFIELVAITMLVFRMVDQHYTGAQISKSFFAPVIWSTNFSYVVLCYAALIQSLVQRSQKWNW